MGNSDHKKGKILIVDDEPFNCEIMQEILAEDYELKMVNNGQECLNTASDWLPDLILLDISMPGMSGYEVCRQLKGSVKTQDAQITFVSALDTLADRLAGYEVGGDDYITKPFDADELVKKVEVAFKNKSLQRQLQNHADKAMKTAMSALSSTNEIGMVLQFISATFHCNEYDCLAQLIVDAISAMSYRSTVQIRAEGREINKCSEGTINPLEVAVINRISHEDDHLDIGPRTIMNFEHVSVLVKDMPVNDEEEYARIKENIAVIAEGSEVRINAIEAQNALLARAGLLDVLRQAQQALNALNEKQAEHKQQILALIQQLKRSLQAKLVAESMSSFKIDPIVDLVNKTQKGALAVFDGEGQAENPVEHVIEELQAVINR
ncbi:MAG: response regulator [Gammaproteobacteria bacterium]|nr:response regulator [Gammaproteobacteria bacterium]